MNAHLPRWKNTAAAICLTAAAVFLTAAGRHDNSVDRVRAASTQGKKPKKIDQYVEQGDPGSAKKYYAAIKNELGFPHKEGDRPPLDDLLDYFGYQALQARDIERLPSETLMASDKQLAMSVGNQAEFAAFFKDRPIDAGDILASVFFSPKSTDVSASVHEREYAWRKIVFLKARPDSHAAKKGLSALLLLFNFTGKDVNKSPVGDSADSKNNQAILVRANGARLKNPIYWLAFASIQTFEGRRTDHITASWDAATSKDGGKEKYYLPHACAQCHGGPDTDELVFPNATLNYIDTDHVFDRIQPGDDFQALAKSTSIGAILDGGKDTSSAQFKKAFAVIHKLNSFIYDQNKTVDPRTEQPHVRGAKNWLRVHENTIEHVSLFKRAIPPDAPKKNIWSENDSVDKELLPMLNRFCFRCHSTILYHVLDKEAVLSNVKGMERNVKNGYMPQDRKLIPPVPWVIEEMHDNAAKDNLLKLLGKLRAQAK